MIPSLALLLLFAALGLERVLVWIGSRSRAGDGFISYAKAAAAIALPLSLFLFGPLPDRLTETRSFSNNKCFHVSHAPLQSGETCFSRLTRASGKNLDFRPSHSPFYQTLADNQTTHSVIEYPMLVGDIFTALPDYQRTHGKRVIGGFRPMTPPKRVAVRPGLVPANWPSGMVLGALGGTEALHFDSHVDVDDVAAVRGTGARFLIVHRDPMREVRGQTPRKRSVDASHFEEMYGPVYYEDDRLFVFDLQSPVGR